MLRGHFFPCSGHKLRSDLMSISKLSFVNKTVGRRWSLFISILCLLIYSTTICPIPYKDLSCKRILGKSIPPENFTNVYSKHQRVIGVRDIRDLYSLFVVLSCVPLTTTGWEWLIKRVLPPVRPEDFLDFLWFRSDSLGKLGFQKGISTGAGERQDERDEEVRRVRVNTWAENKGGFDRCRGHLRGRSLSST